MIRYFMAKKRLDISITANETDLLEFMRLCGVIQFLGEVGSSREIKLFIDGDGSARFKFLLNNEFIPSTPINLSNKEITKIYLGE